MPHLFRPQPVISDSHEGNGNPAWFPPASLVDVPHVPNFASVCFMAPRSIVSGSESYGRATS